ncbi:MAG: sigma 54-interacting transcriptional regulator [Candidatus Zixiibacteriota bacterium]
MKPLPHHDAVMPRPPLRQVQVLLDEKNWPSAAALLEVHREESLREGSSPDYGVWCLLRARLAAETGEYRDGVDWGRRGLIAFQASAADDFLGDAHSVLGLAYLGLGDTKNARIHARDALAIYRRLDDESGMMRAYNELARIHFVRGEYEAADDFLSDAIQIARRRQDAEKEAMLLGNAGRVCLLQGRWSEAQEALSAAHQCAVSAGNRVSIGRNLLSMAYLAILRHDFRAASSQLDAALTVIEDAGLVRERAVYFEYSGWWQYEQKHWIAAKEAFRRALEIGRRLSDENDMVSQSLRGLAECEAALQDWPEAKRLAEQGLAVAIAIGDRAEVGCLYRVLARAQARLGDHTDSRATLAKATECLTFVGDVYERARLAIARSEVLALVSPADHIAPTAALDEAVQLYSRLGATDNITDVQWLAVDSYRRAGQITEAVALARRLIAAMPTNGAAPDRMRELVAGLDGDCVGHATSPRNEFRLVGMPWTAESLAAAAHAESAGDDLQQTIAFCRTRLNASRVLLLEVTADGRRSGRVVAQSGGSEGFAQRVAAFAASAYQRELPTDQPRYHWSLLGSPQLTAHLVDETGRSPVSVISVPVELGPASSGILYLDRIAEEPANSESGFSPRDLDFAVAYAEIVAWRSMKLRSEGLLRDVQRLRDQLGRECEFPSIITQNAAFREILARARLIVDADVSILLQGETGTGKDLLARAIHYSGNRRDQRFVQVNCAALPETLLESELFGARRGAYTGADRDKIGLFEEADGGTFFLDEIGEMPLSIQAKLLRLLETKEVLRLGDTKPRPVNVRVISATNRNLTQEMERGTFRRDLFYRLTPLVFVLPPLRERREDVPLLIDHFLDGIAAETGRTVRLSSEVVRVLCAYHWPGNVRELENEIRKLVLLAEPGAVIGPDRLSRKFAEESPAGSVPAAQPMPERFSLYDHIARIERQFIVRALGECGGVKKHAAQRLDIPESTLRLKMKIYDIDTD